MSNSGLVYCIDTCCDTCLDMSCYLYILCIFNKLTKVILSALYFVFVINCKQFAFGDAFEKGVVTIHFNQCIVTYNVKFSLAKGGAPFFASVATNLKSFGARMHTVLYDSL